MCWVGLTFVCSFDGTPIALPDKVLVPLVIPRCEVISVEFFCRKSASHLSVHVELLLLLCDTNGAGCCYNDQPVLRECRLRHNPRKGDGLTSSYQSILNFPSPKDILHITYTHQSLSLSLICLTICFEISKKPE